MIEVARKNNIIDSTYYSRVARGWVEKEAATRKSTGRVFTDEQTRFMRENDMDNALAHRLAKKYGSGTDAIRDLVNRKGINNVKWNYES